MSRWTVSSGDQVMVIESTDAGLVSVDISPGPLFVGGADEIQDIRTKLGLAIGAIRPDSEGSGNQP